MAALSPAALDANAWGRGVRAAAEQLGATRLRNLDSHRWICLEADSPLWVCVRCHVQLETGSTQLCEGLPME
jgi:hypothetical protein